MSTTVFLADDHVLFRSGVRALLEPFTDVSVVGEAGNGRELLKQLQNARADVVLMEMEMPLLNGVDATRQVLADWPDVRVLGVSARTDGQSVGQMLKAGASGYVPKSANIEELVEGIQTVAKGGTFLARHLAGGLVDYYIRQTNGDNGNGHSGEDSPLSNREREVLQLVAEGYTLKQIAAHLYVSIKTVESHRQALMRKLAMRSVADLTKYAIREGLTALDR